MKNKINISEILKDCPTGMELDCALFENLEFDHIDKNSGAYSIICRVKTEWGGYNVHTFTEYGCYSTEKYSKCVIFPKGKKTWKEFHRPFKDGDIIYVCDEYSDAKFTYVAILKQIEKGEKIQSHCFYNFEDDYFSTHDFLYDGHNTRFATEKEKETLFKTIKDNGYKWNEETKTLEKLFEPKFHKGDWVTDGINKCQIYFIDNTNYWYSDNCILGSIESVDKRYHLWTIDDAIDGNVLFHLDSASNGIFIFKEILQLGTIQKVICYCDYDSEDGFCLGENHTCCWADSKIIHPATEKQRNLLFRKMKEAGYKWNLETKTLEKLIEPKFKVGDRIIHKVSKTSPFTITEITDTSYKGGYRYEILIEQQDNFELVPNKFDITTLKPFDKVLARCSSLEKWCIQLFEKFDETGNFPFICMGYNKYKMCIPYEGNEHLIGKTGSCDEYYKTW
jgi:hypothetical protein